MTNIEKLRTLNAHDLAKIIGHIVQFGEVGDIDDILAEHDDSETGYKSYLQDGIEVWLNEQYEPWLVLNRVNELIDYCNTRKNDCSDCEIKRFCHELVDIPVEDVQRKAWQKSIRSHKLKSRCRHAKHGYKGGR